jgi:hypothetical protein
VVVRKRAFESNEAMRQFVEEAQQHLHRVRELRGPDEQRP